MRSFFRSFHSFILRVLHSDARIAKQQTALKKMPHLSKTLGKIAYTEETCKCDCPVNQAFCDLHNAFFEKDSCSCQCDESAKRECEAGAPGKFKWLERGCYCQCLVTAEECAALPTEKEGGTRKILDTSGACGCTCADGLGTEKEFCDLKMSMGATGNNFEWNENLCQCTCTEKEVCKSPKNTDLHLQMIFDENECKCVTIQDALCPTNVHRGCRWLFKTLDNGIPLLEAKFPNAGRDLADYPNYATCDIVIDSSMSANGLRASAPDWLQAQLGPGTKHGKMMDQIAKNVGTHCRSACYNRFNSLKETKHSIGAKTSATADVTMNRKSCHVFSRKDVHCLDPKPLDDPKGNTHCQLTSFRSHFDAIFHPSSKKLSKDEDTWKRHVLERESRTSKSSCQGKQCETKSPPNALFVEALSFGWPEQEVDAVAEKTRRSLGESINNGMRSKKGKKKTTTKSKKKTATKL